MAQETASDYGTGPVLIRPRVMVTANSVTGHMVWMTIDILGRYFLGIYLGSGLRNTGDC